MQAEQGAKLLARVLRQGRHFLEARDFRLGGLHGIGQPHALEIEQGKVHVFQIVAQPIDIGGDAIA